MTLPPESFSQPPTLAEINRRVERLERIAEGQVVTVGVYTAEKAAHTIEVAAMNQRLTNLEDSIQAATRLLIAAFLAIIGQAVFVALQVFGKG